MHDVESPGLVEAIVRTIREPLLILDEQLNVRAASPAFYRAFHANAADTVGHALFELGDGQWDIAALRELLEVILPLEASAEDFEVALDSPHLGRRFMVLNARRLEGKAERLILLAIQDVTERGVRNKELERSKQAEKMEAVGRLAAGVAHDLNNLLTAIEGHASILLAEIPEDDRLRDDVEEIRSAGRRAANLTWQLLAFSRKQKLEERRIDLVRAARELQSMLVRLVPERIDFRIEAGTGEIVVRADPSQLQQVLMNLVVNAVDAIDEAGSITVSIDAKDVTSAGAEEIPWDIEVGPYARVTVRDTGHGMDPEVLSRIFEPFFTTRAEGHGTGLGLAMVYGVVKQSGGHVLVDSARGRGTTFEVLLPRLAGETVDTTEPVAGRSRSTKGVVVLLVEDDAAVRKVANRILSRAGCVVLEASNGREALEMADRYDGTIDVVFSDVVMPDMGGVEMQKRLKTGHPGLRVVLTSGYSESEVHGEIRELGATFVPKPYSPDALLSSISQGLKHGGSTS